MIFFSELMLVLVYFHYWATP